MPNDDVLEALYNALNTHRNVNSGYDNWPEQNRQKYDRARAWIESLRAGNEIADGWSIEDVKSLRGECDIEQVSADGEDDGLTWFRCLTHDADTLDERDCGQNYISDEIARKTLALAQRNMDANYGINWDSLRAALEVVQEEENE